MKFISSLAFFCLMISSAFATSSKLDLTKAENIMCRSNALGNFYLANLKSNPHYFASTKKAIVVEKTTKSTLTFRYRDYEGYRFKLVLKSSVEHEDVDGSRYVAFRGNFVNGDIESSIECLID